MLAQLALVLLPPDAGATTAVEIEHHLTGAVAGFFEPFFIGLAQLDPELYFVRVVLAPELGFIIGAQSLGELQSLGSVPGKGRQPDHHPLIGFGGVARQREGEVLIQIAIHIRQTDLGLEYGCLESHRKP